MPGVDERLTGLEGRVQEQGAAVAALRESLAEGLRDVRREISQQFQLVESRFQLVDQRFQQIDQRFQQVDHRFQQVDNRFQQVDQRFQQVDQRFDEVYRRFIDVDRRFDRVERLLLWTLGVVLTGFAAVTSALLGIVYRLP